MCNGFNHPSDCNCGWGGVYYDNKKSLREENFITYEKIKEIDPNKKLLALTRCPKCREPVFFVQHNDGCVWLDDLGKPWPKHACFYDIQKQEQPFGIANEIYCAFESLSSLFHYLESVKIGIIAYPSVYSSAFRGLSVQIPSEFEAKEEFDYIKKKRCKIFRTKEIDILPYNSSHFKTGDIVFISEHQRIMKKMEDSDPILQPFEYIKRISNSDKKSVEKIKRYLKRQYDSFNHVL